MIVEQEILYRVFVHFGKFAHQIRNRKLKKEGYLYNPYTQDNEPAGEKQARIEMPNMHENTLS